MHHKLSKIRNTISFSLLTLAALIVSSPVWSTEKNELTLTKKLVKENKSEEVGIIQRLFDLTETKLDDKYKSEDVIEDAKRFLKGIKKTEDQDLIIRSIVNCKNLVSESDYQGTLDTVYDLIGEFGSLNVDASERSLYIEVMSMFSKGFQPVISQIIKKDYSNQKDMEKKGLEILSGILRKQQIFSQFYNN